MPELASFRHSGLRSLIRLQSRYQLGLQSTEDLPRPGGSVSRTAY